MGQPRASRRKVISDEDDSTADDDPAAIVPVVEERLAKPRQRTDGKLKPVKKGNKAPSLTSASPSNGEPSRKVPTRREGSKANGQAIKQEPPKVTAKPIYSFFNAATQRQQASQGTISSEKPSTPHEDTEAIHDVAASDASVKISKASATALAVRKRKAQSNDDVDDSTTLFPPATQKFRKTSDTGKTPSFAIVNEDSRPWIEQFAPRDLSELAVHKRKVTDVQHWFESAFNGKRRKVLVLKGAAGTGKTATVRLLANDMRFELSEWRNPASFEQQAEGSSTGAAQFEDFIRRAGTPHGLTLSTDYVGPLVESPNTDSTGAKGDVNAKQVLLVEEFPSTFSRTSTALQSFRSTVLQYVSSPQVQDSNPVPIVLVISETLLSTNTAAADSFTAHRLLGPELITHPYVNTIEFNPIAPTILTKALETIVVKEARVSGRRKTPGPQVLMRLAESGDVRSAISSLEFLCVRGDDGDTWSSKVAFTKPKKAKDAPPLTKSEEEALSLISNRKSTLGIFHSVGKVVYNKRVQPASRRSLAQPPFWMPHHRRPLVPETDVDSLIDELGTDTPTFLAALHENYALSCSCPSAEGTMDSLCGCIGDISDADMLSVDRLSFGTRAFSGSTADGLRQDELSFQVAVRGLLFSLPSPVHRSSPADGKRGDAHRMFYPTSLKTWKQHEEVDGILELLTSRVQDGTLHQSVGAYQQKSALAGSVESWKKNTAPRQHKEPSSSNGDDAGQHVCSAAKSEMLTDRLPYMAHIMSANQARQASRTLDQILSVIRVQQTSSIVPEDDEMAAYGGDDSIAMSEQWTTDIPDAEAYQGAKQPARPGKKRGQVETEGGGLSIPVEHHVERLVLEDDDIVDD